MKSDKEFWSERWEESKTGWDIGNVSTPIKEYIDQLQDKSIKILLPGAGNAYEAEYLFRNGFKNVYVLDIAQIPLDNLKKRIPDFPIDHLIKGDFFFQQGQYDLVIEQTFFCSFQPFPKLRMQYVDQIYSLLKTNGKLVGLWFDFPLTDDVYTRPFGGSLDEYISYFESKFSIKAFARCYNSIEPRQGKELFGIFEKR